MLGSKGIRWNGEAGEGEGREEGGGEKQGKREGEEMGKGRDSKRQTLIWTNKNAESKAALEASETRKEEREGKARRGAAADSGARQTRKRAGRTAEKITVRRNRRSSARSGGGRGASTPSSREQQSFASRTGGARSSSAWPWRRSRIRWSIICTLSADTEP